jgi:uncharacterized RDD family membrane protein YckC
MDVTPTAAAGDRLRVETITGVPIEFAIAGPGGRSYAFIIDWHIRVLIAGAWMAAGILILNSIEAPGETAANWLAIGTFLPSMLVYFLYHPVLEVAMGGRTPGKRIAGMRIVTLEGTTPGAGPLLVRNLFRFVDGLPMLYVVGLVTIIVSRRHQRVGDLAAGTLLVYEQAEKAESLLALPGAGAARGVATADAELVQDLIDRWPSLEPQQRLALASRLLDRLDPQAGGSHAAWLNDGNAIRALQAWLGGIR